VQARSSTVALAWQHNPRGSLPCVALPPRTRTVARWPYRARPAFVRPRAECTNVTSRAGVFSLMDAHHHHSTRPSPLVKTSRQFRHAPSSIHRSTVQEGRTLAGSKATGTGRILVATAPGGRWRVGVTESDAPREHPRGRVPCVRAAGSVAVGPASAPAAFFLGRSFAGCNPAASLLLLCSSFSKDAPTRACSLARGAHYTCEPRATQRPARDFFSFYSSAVWQQQQQQEYCTTTLRSVRSVWPALCSQLSDIYDAMACELETMEVISGPDWF
jgi:hypothetical protein